MTGTVPKQFSSEYVPKKLKFKRKESSEYKGHTSCNTNDGLQQSLNGSRQIHPRYHRRLSKEASFLIKKDTSALHDQVVKSTNSTQKDEIPQSEVRSSSQEQTFQTIEKQNSVFDWRKKDKLAKNVEKNHQSKEASYLIKKDTSELHDQEVKSLNTIQKDETSFAYAIPKFEARPSKRNQGTDSRNRTTNMENEEILKGFLDGLQKASSSQTKDNPNSEVSFTTHGGKEIDTVKLRNPNDNPVFEAKNVRGENEESLTHGVVESLIKFGEQTYPYRFKAEIYQQAIPTQPSHSKSQNLYNSLANQKTIDLKDTSTDEYILKMIESSDGQNFPAELKDFLKDLQQVPSSQTKDIPNLEFRL